jgi:6-phosphogluconolactonase
MKEMILVSMMMCFFCLAHAQKTAGKSFDLLIGTYTKKDPASGIHVYDFNSETGEFSFKSKIGDVINPSYLAVSKDRKHVYSVSEAGEGKGVFAYAFDPKSGDLKFLNSASSGGNGPCYISVDDKNKFVFVGNYGGGSLAAVPVNPDGSLGSDIQAIQHQGSGVNKNRQEKPHVHSTVLSPDNRFLFVPDLGTDKVNIYKVDLKKKSQPLTPGDPAFVSVKDGSGPRHFTFHPNGKFAYLILEMEAAIVAFDYKDGKLTSKQSITMLAPDFKGDVGAADIHVSPDGKFLYGSNRGEANEIVIYSIDKNGKLTYAGRQSTMGKTPRNFVIDPTGNFLLVANQNTDDIFIFKRDQKTGLLTQTGKKITVNMPVCLKFVEVN